MAAAIGSCCSSQVLRAGQRWQQQRSEFVDSSVSHSRGSGSYIQSGCQCGARLLGPSSSFISGLNALVGEVGSLSLRCRPGGVQPLRVENRAGGGRPPTGRPPRPRPIPGLNNRGRGPQDDRSDGPLLNDMITVPQVRLLDETQTMLGVVSIEEAMMKASVANLDLVMISPDASPPVVRIVDYSKFRYEQQKKKREAQKKAAANRIEVKELKMRYNIDSHDYDVRMRAAQRFLKEGDKVKVSLQFRGREMEFKDLAHKLFTKFIEELGEDAVVETKITLEGRSMLMVLAPNKVALAKAQVKKEKEERERRKVRERNQKTDDYDYDEDVTDDDSEGEEDVHGEDSDVEVIELKPKADVEKVDAEKVGSL